MSVSEQICTGQAEVTMTPLSRGDNNYQVVLKINGEYFGEFPTYTAAADHLTMLANA